MEYELLYVSIRWSLNLHLSLPVYCTEDLLRLQELPLSDPEQPENGQFILDQTPMVAFQRKRKERGSNPVYSRERQR